MSTLKNPEKKRKSKPDARTGHSTARNSSLRKPTVPKGITINVNGMRLQFGMSQLELARITGYSLRSIAGWESGKPLSESARQKLTETERLRIALSQIIPAKQVGAWLRTSNSAFEGQTPIQVIERGEADRIWRMIFQINAGVAS